MPVRSLNSPIIKWPNKETVYKALNKWLRDEITRHPDLVRLGYFGSYARGDWGVGSDLDLLALVEHTDISFEMRGLDWDLYNLPIPVDILVYTIDEWHSLLKGAKDIYKGDK